MFSISIGGINLYVVKNADLDIYEVVHHCDVAVQHTSHKYVRTYLSICTCT